ncbi:putative cytokinetic ring protein SteA [Brevibacillus migulae]|uniref:putative cytokinetic ring protein SteA n=1 Tax=Brevibacillus migulae TaxID=1644114 RepID=UPI0038B398B1
MKRKRSHSDLLVGKAVADSKTKRLSKRIGPQQIAVLHHVDVDEVAAESLLEAKIGAVINTAPFLTGAYPAMGAMKLFAAGIPLFEVIGDEPEAILRRVDGAMVTISDERLYLHENDWEYVAPLRRIKREDLHEKWQEAHRQLDRTLSAFIDNTLTFAGWEKDLFLKPLRKLPLKTNMMNKHVVVVVRGKHYKEDLRILSSYIKECRPVLIAVDGGADALLENGYRPDLIVGDMDSISDRALLCGAEIVVHAFPDGRAPGRARVEQLNAPFHLLPAPGTSEDVAMLIAFEEEAELIVTIGTHTNMIDFLEKGRKGMASTLLVRTKIGPKLIDAKGVSQLYQPRLSWNAWALFVVASLVPIGAILAINPVTRHVAQMLWMQWRMLSF